MVFPEKYESRVSHEKYNVEGCVLFFLLFMLVKTAFHSVAQASLGLEAVSCISFLSARIMVLSRHAWPLCFGFISVHSVLGLEPRALGTRGQDINPPLHS